MSAASLNEDPQYSRILSDIASHLDQHEATRLELYRRYLQWSVRSASPLVARVVDPVTLDAAFETLEPEISWPEIIPVNAGGAHGWTTGSVAQRVAGAKRRHSAKRFAYKNFSVLLRAPSRDVAGVGVRIVENCLEVRLFGDKFLITTHRGSVTVDVEMVVPETLLGAMQARRLADIVDYPVFANTDYLIKDATSDGHYITLIAKTGVVPHRMPWPHLVRVP
ncbi:MAG: hypothetical protein ABI216_13405 [Devosia sp.]